MASKSLYSNAHIQGENKVSLVSNATIADPQETSIITFDAYFDAVIVLDCIMSVK